MRFLLHFGLDNRARLRGRVHYFEYKGVRFKLIQNDPQRWVDVLLTIVGSSADRDVQPAYEAAGEFASALCWQRGFATSLRPLGGGTCPDDLTLRHAKCTFYSFPELPMRGVIGGHSLSKIARIDTSDQRTGLTLFREALGSNKTLLQILLYWQILEVGGGDPSVWVDQVMSSPPQGIPELAREVRELSLGGRSLGQYLLQDCRHAIAHIRRSAGRRSLLFDNARERDRLYAAASITKHLARHYISSTLGVTQSLYLVRRRGRGFPTYKRPDEIAKAPHTLVSQPPSVKLPRIRYQGPRRLW